MISKENVTKGDWVLVEFATKRYIKYYAGNIATVLRDEDDGDFVCSFLQKKANSQFTWPQQKDQSIIDVSQIKIFLPGTRSSFVFHIDFSKFNGKIFEMVKSNSVIFCLFSV